VTTVTDADQALWQKLAVWEGPGKMDLAATKAACPVNDLNAARLLNGKLYPGLLHYVPGQRGTWYVWDGRCHRPDESAAIGRLIQDYAAHYALMLRHAQQDFNGAVAAANPQVTGGDLETLQARRWKAEWGSPGGPASYAAKIQSAAGLAALRMVLSEQAGVSDDTMADHWPYCLNVANGILDLRTGDLHPHDPAAMMTYALDAAWDPAARCPRYERLLYRSTGEVAETYAFLVKVLGYALIGENPLAKVFFLNGPPANGKTALLRVLRGLLGPLGHNAEPSLVCKSRDGRNAREEHSVRGVRAIVISETSSGIHIDEAQLKRLTGEAEITTHQHYAMVKNRTAVTWLIIFATNEMPMILHLDGGARRRICVVPMGPSIPEAEWDDTMVAQILAEEASGVLALLAWGCRAALAERFRAETLPTGVLAETQQYITDQDTIETWLSERADVVAPGLNGERPKEQPALLWHSYHRFYGPQPHLNRQEFFAGLAGRHGVERSMDKRWFYGVRLREDEWVR
jgi:putative DNA primase/helicase